MFKEHKYPTKASCHVNLFKVLFRMLSELLISSDTMNKYVYNYNSIYEHVRLFMYVREYVLVS